ncbi:MAG: hypothetical protein LBF22_07650 [Deltaproteobacteria bacterium]|jgi:hypothetical protein|nr:hypothetical protein [Deltaproteobacteria bacterium]
MPKKNPNPVQKMAHRKTEHLTTKFAALSFLSPKRDENNTKKVLAKLGIEVRPTLEKLSNFNRRNLFSQIGGRNLPSQIGGSGFFKSLSGSENIQGNLKEENGPPREITIQIKKDLIPPSWGGLRTHLSKIRNFGATPSQNFPRQWVREGVWQRFKQLENLSSSSNSVLAEKTILKRRSKAETVKKKEAQWRATCHRLKILPSLELQAPNLRRGLLQFSLEKKDATSNEDRHFFLRRVRFFPPETPPQTRGLNLGFFFHGEKAEAWLGAYSVLASQ